MFTAEILFCFCSFYIQNILILEFEIFYLFGIFSGSFLFAFSCLFIFISLLLLFHVHLNNAHVEEAHSYRYEPRQALRNAHACSMSKLLKISYAFSLRKRTQNLTFLGGKRCTFHSQICITNSPEIVQNFVQTSILFLEIQTIFYSEFQMIMNVNFRNEFNEFSKKTKQKTKQIDQQGGTLDLCSKTTAFPQKAKVLL